MNAKLLLVVALLSVCSAGVFAQDNAQKALARAQYMLQQVNQEKLALEQKNAELGKELEKLKSALAEQQGSAESRQNKLQDNLGFWKQKYEELSGKLKTANAQLAQSGNSGKQLADELALQTENFNICYVNNLKLYDINQELLTLYNDKSAWDALAQREPFTGVKEVELETIIQDYRFANDDLNLSLNQHVIAPVTGASTAQLAAP